MEISSISPISIRTENSFSIKRLTLVVIAVALYFVPLPNASATTTITGGNTVVACDTSALINFNTSVPAHAFIEYGTTTSYGLSTIDDPVRWYKEHAIVLTGLTPSIVYHYRIVATGDQVTQSTDRTFTTSSSGVACPALPAQVDTRMPDMSGAVEQIVTTSTQFTSALSAACAATGKRIITVNAGLTLTGQFTLCNKVDSNWIVVRSSAHASLAEGTRVTPSQANLMFKIQNTNTDAPIVTVAGSHHWRFIGAEVTISSSAQADAPGGFGQSGLIRIGVGNETSVSQLPHHIIIDRCYIHGLPTKNDARGIYYNGEQLGFIENYIDEIHSTQQDAQAILGGMGSAVKVWNNHLEGAGENFMAGGVGITIAGYFPKDIDYRYNYHVWPLRWKLNHPSSDGFDWVTKNQFEIKNGWRVFVFANLWEQWWPSEQTSGPINMKTSNEDTSAPTKGDDIVFYKNIVRKTGMGLIQQARDSALSWPQTTAYSKRLWYLHNIVEVDGTTWTNEGDTGVAGAATVATAMMLLSAATPDPQYPDYVNVIHNTFVNANPTPIGSTGGNLLLLGDQSATHKGVGFVYKDNIVGHREYGVKANATGVGTVALNVAFTGYVFTTNMIVGGASTAYPTGNLFPTNWSDAGFVNFNNGVGGNYRLASGDGVNAASDGTNMGADIDAVERATESTFDGDWPATGGSPQDVVWTGLENATATGSSLQKTGGTSTDLDAGGYSTQSIVSGDGYVEFKKPSTTSEVWVALSSNFDPSYGEMAYDYAIVAGPTGWAIYENGVYQTDGASVANNDVFKIEISSGVVRYYRNGSLIDTSSLSVVYPVKLVGSIETPNAIISEAKIVSLGGGSGAQDIVWTGLENATATGSSLQKTGGTSTDLDAGGYSTQSIVSGDGYVEFKKPSTTSEVWCALSSNFDPSYGEMAYDYAIPLGPTGWGIYENGVYRTDGTGANNDVFKIEITSGVVRYYRNGSLIYTSSQSVVYPVKLVCSIETPNAIISEAKIDN